MNIVLNYGSLEEEKDIKSLDEVYSIMKQFVARNSLPDESWISFRIKGEFNITKKVRFDHNLEALFG